jgi:hypothetical protein
MMARFLIKAGRRPRGRNSVIVATELNVQHPIKYRRAEERDTPIGRIRRLESTGKRDSRRFHFSVAKGTFGTGNSTSEHRCQTESSATAAGVKKVVRVLRPQEEEKLDALDRRRRELLDRLDEVESDRDELVREAFSKGHVVRISDLEEMAVEYERRWQERKRVLNSLEGLDAAALRKLRNSEAAKAEPDSYLIDRITDELEKR